MSSMDDSHTYSTSFGSLPWTLVSNGLNEIIREETARNKIDTIFIQKY